MNHLVEIAAKTGLSSALYKGVRIIQRFMGMGRDNKERSDVSSPRSSKYGTWDDRAHIIFHASLVIIDEAYLIE